jgi:signal peptidase I
MGTFDIYDVSASSMEDTLFDGDRLVVRTVAVHGHHWWSRLEPERGKVIVFRAPYDRKVVLVKRIVGIGGNRLRVYQGKLIVDGIGLNERYVRHQQTYIAASDSWPVDDGESAGVRTVTVPNGSYFVLGDNRDLSFDSRGFGSIPGTDVIGVVVCAIHRWRPVKVGVGDMNIAARPEACLLSCIIVAKDLLWDPLRTRSVAE